MFLGILCYLSAQDRNPQCICTQSSTYSHSAHEEFVNMRAINARLSWDKENSDERSCVCVCLCMFRCMCQVLTFQCRSTSSRLCTEKGPHLSQVWALVGTFCAPGLLKGGAAHLPV